MSENDNTVQASQSLTFEALGYLANQPPIDDPDESQQLETYANELTTNIIKHASQTAGRDHDENLDNTEMDNTNELNFNNPQTTTNGIHGDNDFDYEDIQNKMNGVIQDIQSRSNNDFSRKSTTSNHLHDNQLNISAPTIIDPLTNNSTQGPIRTKSDSDLVDHHISSNEHVLPLPIRQDESSSDIDDIYGIKTGPTSTAATIDDSIDQYRSEQGNHKTNPLDDNDEFFNTKTATINDDQRVTDIIKQNALDETARFGTISSPRVQSPSSKQSVRLTPDEPSTSSDEKRSQMSPSKLPDDAGNDTDRDNQEVAIIARRPSLAKSPVPRPRSPTPNDSRKMSINNEPLTKIISPESPRESINKNDQQETSRPINAIKTKLDDDSVEPSGSRPSSSRTSHFITTYEQSKLIKSGEQLQIPTDDFDNERLNSPPPLTTDIKSLVLLNPLLGSNLVQTGQDQSRSTSETNRASPTTSTISNEKVIDGDVLPSKGRRGSDTSQQQLNNIDQKSTSRRESQIIEQTPQISSSRRTSTSQQQDELDRHREQQVASQQTNDVPQEPTSHRGSFVAEQQTPSRRESATLEQKPPSRKESTTLEQKPPSRKASTASEQQSPTKRESIAPEQQAASRKASTASEQQPPSKRESIVPEQQAASRKASTASEQQPPSKRESIAHEQQAASRKASTASEQQPPSKRESIAHDQQIPSQRESTADEQKPSSRKVSTASEQQHPSKRESIALEQQIPSRRESTGDEQKVTSRKASTASEQQHPSKKESIVPEQEITSRKASTASEQKAPSKRSSVAPEQPVSSRRESFSDEQKMASRKESTASERQPRSKRESLALELQESSRRESHISEHQISHRRQPSFNQQEEQLSGKPVSRKTSVVEQEQQIPSLQESQQQASSSRRSSTHRDNQPSSPRRLSNVHASSSQESSRRSSITKQERTLSIDKRQKSSSTTDENRYRRSSFQRRSGQESKRNSNLITDETVVTPIVIDSSKVRQHSGKHIITTDSYDQTSASKLPSVQQEKPRRSDTLNKQQIPISDRSEIKHLSSSHATSPSEDDRPTHWTKQILIPSIHLTDDEILSSREDQPRPKSPNVEQIAERNPPVPSPPITTAKKRDGKKRKEKHHQPRRSTSADSATNIQLVDDNSLDSTPEDNVDFDRHKRRHIKPKKKDVETNTDQIFDSQQQQRSFFDEKELSPKKPLKATKPLSDHLHPTRRRVSTKEIFTTPDTIPDTDTPSVRHTVKKTQDSIEEKEPVHVNVTVVVKKFSGTSKDGTTSHTTTEAFVDQKPQQYFEHVQHPSETLPLPLTSATTENKEKSEELIERPRSIDHQQIKSSEEKILEHCDRYTQSDTEQIITEQQKKRRKPKRISRTSQTYESVFRRMEREQQQDLRATSDTEKNIQTRKSQLRPRKKSPKKNLPVYLSTDSFRLEELLPKQYHQSRRNLSKSSSIPRSLSPQGGKLLILRPTLPFHHTDAVNVHRVCLQYAIDLVPNENLSTPRNKLTVLKQPEQTNNLPMISASSSGVNIPTTKSNVKEKSASYKSEDFTHQRKSGGAF